MVIKNLKISLFMSSLIVLSACNKADESSLKDAQAAKSAVAVSGAALPVAAEAVSSSVQEQSATPARQFKKDSFEDYSSDLSGLEIKVIKNTGCGCCEAWAEHLRNNGALVSVSDGGLPSERLASLNIPESSSSCHTGVIGNFIFEGHVPASAIKKFLLNPVPGSRGLTVPGMPVGSPGMESGSSRDPFKVMVLMDDGTTTEYLEYK